MILLLAYLFGVLAAVAIVDAVPGLLGYLVALPTFAVSTVAMGTTVLRVREILGGEAA